MENSNSKSIWPIALILLGLLVMSWNPILGLIAILCAFWAAFIRWYLIPKYKKKPGLLDLSWETEMNDELSEIWNLAEVQEKPKEAQRKLWDYMALPKSKQFFFAHLRHMEFILIISTPIFGLIALFIENISW